MNCSHLEVKVTRVRHFLANFNPRSKRIRTIWDYQSNTLNSIPWEGEF